MHSLYYGQRRKDNLKVNSMLLQPNRCAHLIFEFYGLRNQMAKRVRCCRWTSPSTFKRGYNREAVAQSVCVQRILLTSDDLRPQFSKNFLQNDVTSSVRRDHPGKFEVRNFLLPHSIEDVWQHSNCTINWFLECSSSMVWVCYSGGSIVNCYTSGHTDVQIQKADWWPW